MPDYANGKIYKIVCNKTNKVYIGSTTLTLHKRLLNHKSDSNSTTRRNCKSSDIIINNDYYIELIEDYPCLTRKELLSCEYEIKSKYECINVGRNYCSKEERDEYNKNYRFNHKKEISEYCKNNKDRTNYLRRERYNNNPEYTKKQRDRANAFYKKKVIISVYIIYKYTFWFSWIILTLYNEVLHKTIYL